tara:strand:- start:85436 stop:86371 length:936 start_codon:yes stop_codon:yes gene_type:complete
MDATLRTNFTKGYAFEWNVGLDLQMSYEASCFVNGEGTGRVIPQARLNKPQDEQGFVHAFLDFYGYTPDTHTGSVYSVKWWNGPGTEHLEQDRAMLEQAVDYEGNAQVNSGDNINIKVGRVHQTRRGRQVFENKGGIYQIVQDTVKGYKGTGYGLLREEPDYGQPDSIGSIQNWIRQTASDRDFKALEELEQTLYRIFMHGFEQDAPLNFLHDYVKNFLNRGDIIPTGASYNYDPRNPHHHRRFGVVSDEETAETTRPDDFVKHVKRQDGSIETTLMFVERVIWEPPPEPEENLDLTHPDNFHLVGNRFIF